MLQFYHCLFIYVVAPVNVSFEQLSLNVSEANGTVEICVVADFNATNPPTDLAILGVIAESGSAQRKKQYFDCNVFQPCLYGIQVH